MNIVEKIKLTLIQMISISSRIEDLQQAIGRVEIKQVALINSNNIQTNEFKKFLQWGENVY